MIGSASASTLPRATPAWCWMPMVRSPPAQLRMVGRKALAPTRRSDRYSKRPLGCPTLLPRTHAAPVYRRGTQDCLACCPLSDPAAVLLARVFQRMCDPRKPARNTTRSSGLDHQERRISSLASPRAVRLPCPLLPPSAETVHLTPIINHRRRAWPNPIS